MGLLDRFRSKHPVVSGTFKFEWALDAKGKFHRLFDLDPDEAGLGGAGGVYVIWHGGVRPKWVFVGESADLRRALIAAANNEDIGQYDVNGRLSVTWALMGAKYRPGVVLYLTQAMEPLVDNPAAPSAESKVNPITVDIPKRRPG